MGSYNLALHKGHPTLDKSTSISTFHGEAAAIADGARRGIDTAIPSCPGWTIATLLGHLGEVYTCVAKYVVSQTTQDFIQEREDLELTPPYETWFRQEFAPAAIPPDVVDWFSHSAAAVGAAFEGANPTDSAWTWLTSDMTAGFWMRRMVHETAIHQWDVERAHGRPPRFDATLARDGIDEMLTVYAPAQCRPTSKRAGTGETFHFHCTDVEGEWVVLFEGDGMAVDRGHAKADVAFRAAASDLYQFLWHRITADQLEVFGDSALAARYFEFCPPD